jgi:hypothetical protein
MTQIHDNDDRTNIHSFFSGVDPLFRHHPGTICPTARFANLS